MERASFLTGVSPLQGSASANAALAAANVAAAVENMVVAGADGGADGGPAPPAAAAQTPPAAAAAPAATPPPPPLRKAKTKEGKGNYRHMKKTSRLPYHFIPVRIFMLSTCEMEMKREYG